MPERAALKSVPPKSSKCTWRTVQPGVVTCFCPRPMVPIIDLSASLQGPKGRVKVRFVSPQGTSWNGRGALGMTKLPLDVEIIGKGRNLVLLHSLLSDRFSFE